MTMDLSPASGDPARPHPAGDPTGRGPAPDGGAAEAISAEIALVHRRVSGREPIRVQTFVQEEFTVCVLRGVSTEAEEALVEDLALDQAKAARTKINEAMERDCTTIVEAWTGRDVRACSWKVRPEDDVSAWLFVLGDGLDA